MSALGSGADISSATVMSALHPKATVKADVRNGSCLLSTQKPTSASPSSMSAKGQKRTSSARRQSLDYLICGNQHARRDSQSKCLGRLEVEDRGILSRSLDR